jgi:WD40 repeat protein
MTFDLSDGRCLCRLTVEGTGPRFAVFPKNESFLFAGGLNQSLSFYRVSRSGAILQPDSSLLGHAATINNAALSPDEKRIATASEDETIRVWDRATQTEFLVLRGDASPMNDIAFSPTGGFLAAAQANGAVRIWDGRPGPSSVPPR